MGNYHYICCERNFNLYCCSNIQDKNIAELIVEKPSLKMIERRVQSTNNLQVERVIKPRPLYSLNNN